MTTETTPAETIDLSVGGMTCAGCAATIQKGLAILPGVDGAAVNIATRRATVQADGTLDREDLELAMRAAIEGLGYQVLTKPAGAAGADGAGGDASHRPAAGDELEALADEHAAHVASDAARIADYRRRFLVAVALTAPVLLISMVMPLQFAGWEQVVAILATPVIFWSAYPFHRSTVMSARHRATTMDTLVSLGTVAAWTWSTVVLLGHAAGAMEGAHVYYETGAVIVTLILLGKWLEVRSSARAGDAIRALSSRQSATARLEDGTVIERSALEVGMRFVTRPGETIATDGVVVDGEAAVDASLVTGESVPVTAGPGAEVIGGTIAADGALTVEATRVGAETMLAQIARMVDQAQGGKARIQRLADRVAAIFVPAVIGLSGLTLAGWLLATGDVERAFTAAVAVLIISCPCALGLATPLAIMVGTGRGAQLGTLVRGPDALEDTRDVQVIVLDKTGTVTEGRMEVTATFAPALDDEATAALLVGAASVEARSEHPVAKAIVGSTTERAPLKGFRSTPGHGVTATVSRAGADGSHADVTVGSARMFDRVDDALAAWAREREQAGETVVLVGRSRPLGGGLLGGGTATSTREPLAAEMAIAVRDRIKESTPDAIAAFRDLGLEVVLLTGDNARAARAVADELGIDRVIAEVLPGDKADVVSGLQEGGRRVAMVGDGVNDAPALAQADLGIAIGTGADVAREASDLTIVSGDLRAAADAIALSRRTLGTIRGNLFWAFAYNVAAIPLAALGVLNPMIASAAMGGSSLFVVGNSLRLRGFAGYRARR
ncbi:heavy metal translocating P-type ATPase [Demequina lignilytica]|uniref:Heavy metal translocating P-type ATPase n=1 Tax=Demequina lignilytica TaxID=3051663 RepID=A0AAW7M8V0_9MICO|nr:MULTISPECIES: heavy metal translocating P-type ATPase [unclassified Demequina]MDN4478726.1 heavy metal translocating P-type ATPase [Demequina sp. SYSU T00039-1]MDN4483276.1 heavy metal translocating P-type ATPase [Demequina sp. SYSU T0a273]MDN4488703.1 heavy metal translocating P-type ATPase [Demequina sp. SYSU T00039]